MGELKEFTILKKRAGQDYKAIRSIYCESLKDAKIEFANNCYADLLNGVHGDNFIELLVEPDEVEEDGIYYNGELIFPKSDLSEGIDTFSEDVYTWKLVEGIYKS